MAIIRPSLTFAGSHLGDRFDPEPGKYRATLYSVQINSKTHNSYELEWVITDHHMNNYRWIVRQWFPRKNAGLLSQMLWSWKHKKWGDLGENNDERLEALGKLIGEEAQIRVETLNLEKSNSVRVTEVWPVVMPVPVHWADEVGELD